MNAPQSRLIAYAAGELVFAEGSPGEQAYVVVEGEVELCRRVGEQVSALRTVRAGELFGELAPLTGDPRRASAVARTAVSLESVDREALLQRLREQPALFGALAQRCAALSPASLAVPDAAGRAPRPGAAARVSASPGGALSRWLGTEEAAFDPGSLLLEEAPPPRLLRRVSGAMVAALGGLLAWSCLSSIDVAVPGHGRLAPAQPATVVQAFDQGLLKEVRVAEGQAVKQGDVLALLDPTYVEADERQLERQRVAAEARVARLLAELGERPAGRPFSNDAEAQALEATLLASRGQQVEATLRGQDEDIAALTQQIRARQGELAEQERQRRPAAELAALREGQYRDEREAYQRDGVYKVQYLEASRQLAAVERETLALRESIATLEKQRAARMAQQQAFRSEWRAKVLEELAAQRRELVRVTEQAAKQERSTGLVALRAPLDGVVQRLALRNPGAVVRPAETVVELVPSAGALQVEIDLNPGDIARVRVGDPVRVRLEAFAAAQQVVLPGRVDFVSADVYAQRLDGERQPAYRARVRLDPGHEELLPTGFRLQPGMSASASIHVGQRRLAAYLFYPVQRALGESLREP